MPRKMTIFVKTFFMMKAGSVVLVICCMMLAGCLSKKKLNENLPVDLGMRPRPSDSTVVLQTDQPKSDSMVSWSQLQHIRGSIDSIVSGKICDDASAWRSAPLGSKPCGGPAEYIAYPKESESAVLKLVTRYTALHTRYNRQNQLQSDCIMVTPPLEIRCESGKPVLVYDKSKK